MKFSWSTSERVALKRLAEYSSTPREIKISTFRSLRCEQSRQDFSTKQQEAAAAGAGKFSPPTCVSVHSTDLIDGGNILIHTALILSCCAILSRKKFIRMHKFNNQN